MNEPNELRRKLTINGEDYFLAVGQYGSGPPSSGTLGKAGVLYLDTEASPERLYICTAADPNAGTYTWKPIESILRISSEGSDTTAENGITPHIGENGNWYIGDTDTGVSAQGDPGDPGEDGGHYTPIVTQPTADTMKVEFSASKAGMPPVEPVTINLPVKTGEDSGENVNPVAKTEDMTQPVGMDADGRLWTAPTADNAGNEEESEDILLGTLPMTISESNCYLLSDTNATISTGEGAAQLLDFGVSVPYANGAPTYNSAVIEKVGQNTLKITFGDVTKNASAYFDLPIENGKTYTIVGKLVSHSDDVADAKVPIVRVGDGNVIAQCALVADGSMVFKSFSTETDTQKKAYISFSKQDGYVVGETYATVAVYLYEGEYTELPTGATFDIVAGEKYNTDGYMGATLSAVNGETVQVYQVNTAGAESETDNGGVIFFGDSILHYSDVTSRYAAKTGKPVLNCAVGGTRMSASRDSSNAYYPVDMANIASAIASGDFTAQLNSSVATAGFTTLASANIANYKAMILEFGTNDFTAKVPFDGEDATSIKGAVKHILRNILTSYPNMRIVVLSTLQYVTLGTGTESGVPTHDDGTVWAMNEVIKGVCESDEFCVPWVDMYHAFGQNGITRNTLNSDGVHLTSPNGAKRYADILVGKLNELGI